MTVREQYDRDGFYKAAGLFSPTEAAVLKEETMAVVRERGLGSPEGGLTVWMADALAPPIRRCVCDPRIVRLLQKCIGTSIEFLSVKPVFKDGKTTFGSPWHQDWFYWKGTPKTSIWIALDAATPENGCLRVIPGSHTQLFPLRDAAGARAFVHCTDEAQLSGFQIVDVCMAQGDALIFHDRILHASHTNTSGRDRWSLIPTYRNAAVADDSTVWKTALPVE
ncbi:MAG: phytanoyl-CoA dioxygenase family protein [Lentisphaerae bacterium]|nr:phytanoyl-CoA dioxygenase family protein [Lentisphaerota bacterium]